MKRLPWALLVNNPGRIVDVPRKQWFGQVGQQRGLCRFAMAEDGLRALSHSLLTDQLVFKAKTPTELLTPWATSSKSARAYISAVCARTGFFDIEPIDLTDPLNLYGMELGIIWQENGIQPYTHAQLARSVRETLS